MPFCEYCGAELMDGVLFCNRCGKEVLSAKEKEKRRNEVSTYNTRLLNSNNIRERDFKKFLETKDLDFYEIFITEFLIDGYEDYKKAVEEEEKRRAEEEAKRKEEEEEKRRAEEKAAEEKRNRELTIRWHKIQELSHMEAIIDMLKTDGWSVSYMSDDTKSTTYYFSGGFGWGMQSGHTTESVSNSYADAVLKLKDNHLIFYRTHSEYAKIINVVDIIDMTCYLDAFCITASNGVIYLHPNEDSGVENDELFASIWFLWNSYKNNIPV